jgi:hypothetical protein
LSFRKGDHFILLNDLQNGWFVIVIVIVIVIYIIIITITLFDESFY